MAKKTEAPEVPDEVSLPTADEPAPVEPVAPATPLPLFRVTCVGRVSDSYHAVDESDAIRQYFEQHGYSEKYQARVERIS